jgi:hypothetical protein
MSEGVRDRLRSGLSRVSSSSTVGDLSFATARSSVSEEQSFGDCESEVTLRGSSGKCDIFSDFSRCGFIHAEICQGRIW